MKRAALYVRVSTSKRTKHGDALAFDQDPAAQEKPLVELTQQRGWQLHGVYCDRITGAKESRPGLDELMQDARRGKFDVVAVWRFDRFARSVKQLVVALEEFRSLGIDFVSHQEALDTSTPMGKAMFTIIGAMAELERSVIVNVSGRAWSTLGSVVRGQAGLLVDPDGSLIARRSSDCGRKAARLRRLPQSSASVWEQCAGSCERSRKPAPSKNLRSGRGRRWRNYSAQRRAPPPFQKHHLLEGDISFALWQRFRPSSISRPSRQLGPEGTRARGPSISGPPQGGRGWVDA